jgi:16S rRNA (cytosine1402-N4)-methyltransferase
MSDSPQAGQSAGAPIHQPVLLREVIRLLDLRPGLTIVDGTVGAGGHSQALLSHIGSSGKLIGLDRDPMMLAWAAKTLADPRCILRQASYAQLPEILDDLQIPKVDRILLDLGLSSDQLADSERGFGIKTAGPLDMRFDIRQGISATELLATKSESELADIFFRFGEERHSRAIARTICERRVGCPVRTARDLADAVIESVSTAERRRSEIHPATRVFQALRIAVNAELDQLQIALSTAIPQRLQAGGIAAVISFHSLEDRLVKDAFRDQQTWQNLTSKPVTARPAEQRMNPRSRTAKLRAALRK